MEIQVYKRLTLLIALAALLSVQTLSAQSRKEKADSVVRLMKAESIEQLMIHGQQYRKAISSTFLHNGTYLISDTALWNVDTKVINAVGHVKVIQDETILTSDKLDYLIDVNLAQFRGTLVQLQNKKNNLLRTRYLDYNTKDSVALFFNGAAMRDADGQIIESVSGRYNSGIKRFMFDNNVNMFSDSMFVKTNMLLYDSETGRARFPGPIDFWRGGNMLSADRGWYDRGTEIVFLENNVHAMSQDQEAWADSLLYYKGLGELLMLGNAQVQDPSRDVTAVADRIHYNDSISQVRLLRNAAVVMQTGKEARRDTIYMGADTLIYRTIRRCDIPEGTVKACQTRLSDIMTDPVTEFRRKAAEAAAAAAAEASRPMGGQGGRAAGKTPAREDQEQPGEVQPQEAPPVPEEEAPAELLPPPDSADAAQARKDSLMAPLTNALAAIDSLVGTDDGMRRDSLALSGDLPDSDTLAAGDSIAVSDSLARGDSLAVSDSLAAGDSLAVADSLSKRDTVVLDTTKLGFVYGIRNVRIFREDIQMRCDSMCYCDLDSVARFYLDPIVWNDGNRQYTADSLFILVGGGGPRKASLQSNAFVVIKEDENSYDQIRGTEILAYFDSLDSSLKRFDALGGSSAIFYLRENEVFATVNKVESKMLSGILVNGDIDHVYYFEQPKNNAYPVVQLPDAERKMKGFTWRPDERPAGPEDITLIEPRKSQRSYYLGRPRAEFRETERYFPGYMPGIRREIARRDSLARLPRPKAEQTEIVSPDSLKKELADSLDLAKLLTDSLDFAVTDSLVAAQTDTVGVDPAVIPAADTLVVAPEPEDPLSVHTLDPRQKKKEERELRRKLRIAARDARIAAREARWAELDRQDSLKLAAKKQKELEKQRAQTLKALEAMQKQDAKDQAKLEKYIAKYRKQYEREQKRKAARKRPQAPDEGGEVPAPDGTGEETPRSDAVLREHGSVDDDPVLGGGSVPGS